MAGCDVGTDEFAERAAGALVEALGDRLVAVVLFGSRARGDASESSDWDLLVIAAGLPPKVFDRNLYLKQCLLPEWRGRVSILAKAPEEFRGSVSSLYLDIALDARFVHDPKGFAAGRFLELRRHIERLGLRRERTPEGFDWRWRNPPTGGWSLAWSA